MTRSATSWSGSTAGRAASAARRAAAPPWRAAAGTTPDRARQRYRRKACGGHLDDLTGTVPAGHHQPRRVWVLCLCLMGLNLPSRQTARELDLSQPGVQLMAERRRTGLVARTPAVRLRGEVEIDEAYVAAGHKRNPAAVAKGGARRADGG
jgi:hypothetical protein